jgi:CheY-like chemotaxis protein
VLVVDDEPSIRLLCRVNLELDGYEVREAGSVAEGRERLAEGGIAVALVDVHLGAERSTELVEELRAAGIPVALVTGSVELERLAQSGADAVLQKPFTIDDLRSTVATLAAAGDVRR